jgi:hypothetical protein
LTPFRINCYLHSINWFSTKEIPQVTTDPTADRAALVAGLRSLADFLDEHRDLPVPSYVSGHISVPAPPGDDDERQAFVDNTAAALGTPAAHIAPSGHYVTVRAFGPVEFQAYMIPVAAHARYDALNSYRDSIRLDEPMAA